MGKRSTSRRLAMQSLYQMGINKSEPLTSLQNVIGDADFIDETKEYAQNLINGVTEHNKEILSIISKHSKDWPIGRMNLVDRSILMLATYELLFEKDISKAIIINEAVELSKKYSGSDSPKFINGILGAVADELKA